MDVLPGGDLGALCGAGWLAGWLAGGVTLPAAALPPPVMMTTRNRYKIQP